MLAILYPIFAENVRAAITSADTVIEPVSQIPNTRANTIIILNVCPFVKRLYL